MTVALPPFSGDHPPCVKCGMRDAFTEWVPYRPPVYDRGLIAREAQGEYLKRTCCRCGYFWREACIPPRPQLKK